jgi:hypothetical protein
MTGGTDLCLCEEDASAVGGMARQYAKQMNCLTTAQAMDIVWFLKRARHVKAGD